MIGRRRWRNVGEKGGIKEGRNGGKKLDKKGEGKGMTEGRHGGEGSKV